MSVECPALTVCENQFATRILTDILGEECSNKVNDIVTKLCVSAKTYDQDKSKTNLSIIATDLYDCLKPTANDIARITADELSKTFIYILIITAVFIVLIAVILVVVNTEIYYWWIIIISIIFALLYIALVFFLVYITANNISNSITNSQIEARKCVKIATDALSKYEKDQTQAISNALCAYTNTPVNC